MNQARAQGNFQEIAGQRERRRDELEATTVSGKRVSHTGLELYFKCFTTRIDPITSNYQQIHGKVTVTEGPSQLKNKRH